MACSVSPARLLSLVVLAFPFAAAAQEPPSAPPTTRLIPFSATLPDSGRGPIAGARTITFALFDEAEGGTPLWTETQVVRVDERGRYSAHLGAATPLPLAIFRTEQARWLEVTVDGKALPRTMLVAVPYALRAADAETLGGTPAAEFVRTDANGHRIRADGTTIDDPLVDGSGVPNQLAKWNGATTLSSSIVTESFDNRIGILAPDPTGGGVVDSRFTIRHLDNNTAIGVLNTSNQRRFALNIDNLGGWLMYDGGSNTWNPGLRQVDGRVGVGIHPLAKFEVFTAAGQEAGYFQILNFNNAAPALVGITNGSGPGVEALNGHATGTAVRGVVTASTANLFVGVRAGINRFRVDGNGAVFALGYNTGGADFAEAVEALDGTDAYEPGDVMVIAEGRNRTVDRSTTAYARTVIGIYSTQPGILASPHAVDDPRRAGTLPLAMLGIVPCKVSAENGAVKRGDLLVTSTTPGHAMRGTDASRMTGAIVGKALEPLEGGRGIILVAVTLQ